MQKSNSLLTHNSQLATRNLLREADGHVHWETTPLVGIKRDNTPDNIYTTQTGAVIGSPADANDTIMLPAENSRWSVEIGYFVREILSLDSDGRQEISERSGPW